MVFKLNKLLNTLVSFYFFLVFLPIVAFPSGCTSCSVFVSVPVAMISVSFVEMLDSLSCINS